MSFRICNQCHAVFKASYACCPLDGGALEERVEEPLLGQILDERYRVLECIGEGAMGRVYRVQHVRMARFFAVKVMFGDLAADEGMRKRFDREAQAASRLDHPNVVAAVDVGTTPGGIPYMVMELLEGQSLADWVHERGPLSEAEVLWVGISIARGLAHAHLRGLVHRDLKPDNIFIVEIDGQRLAKILDFGIAFIADLGTNAKLTQTGHIMGTPYYMSPEQCLGEPVDARADLFALGICLFFACTGRPPFGGEAAQVLQQLIVKRVPNLLDVLGEGLVSPELSAVVQRLTEPDREARFSSAEEVVDVLERLRASLISEAPEAALSQPVLTADLVLGSGEMMRPRRRRFGWAAALLALAGVVGGFFAFAPPRLLERLGMPASMEALGLEPAPVEVTSLEPTTDDAPPLARMDEEPSEALRVPAEGDRHPDPERARPAATAPRRETKRRSRPEPEPAVERRPARAPSERRAGRGDDLSEESGLSASAAAILGSDGASSEPAGREPDGAAPEASAPEPVNDAKPVEPSRKKPAEVRRERSAPAAPTPAQVRDEQFFRRRYRQVGAELEELLEADRERGRALRERYFAIDYTAALANEAARRRALLALNALEQQIQSAR